MANFNLGKTIGVDLTPGFNLGQLLGIDATNTKGPQKQQQQSIINQIPAGYKAPGAAPSNNGGGGGGNSPAPAESYAGYAQSTGGGGGGAGSAQAQAQAEAARAIQEQIAALTNQERQINSGFTDIEAAYNQGVNQLNDKYTGLTNQANQNQSSALSKFATQAQDNEKGKQSSYNKVDNNARTLNDSVRKLLGLASGANSSAFQLAAPKAVSRDASGKRQSVTETFGTNARNIDTAQKETTLDFERYINNLALKRQQDNGDLVRDIQTQRNDVDQRLAGIYQQKAAAQGGGFAAQQAAAQPYINNIETRKAEIRGLFDKYRTPVNLDPVKVAVANLGDFAVDKTAINAERQAGGGGDYNPYEYFLNRQRNEEEQKLV